MESATEENPDFRMVDEHGYILDRRHLATARLNLQYFLWQRILKFTIHPSVRLPPAPNIADVATGTGLWMLDAAQERPNARLHGYDVDTTQAPAPGWLPANARIDRWDIFQDPPAQALGSYDLVHVRLLVLVLSGLDPRPVIRRLSSLLKPGGWLQWEDLDCIHMHVKRGLGRHADTLARRHHRHVQIERKARLARAATRVANRGGICRCSVQRVWGSYRAVPGTQ